MPTSKPKTQTLKDFTRFRKGGGDLVHLLHNLASESDHGLAIGGANVLENVIQDFIIMKCVPMSNTDINNLFDVEKPLGNFSAKINLGYAVGLYGKKLRTELHWIRQIRNTFAHHREPVDFSTPAISRACDTLQHYERDTLWRRALEAKDWPWPPRSGREKYGTSIVAITWGICWRYQGREPEGIPPKSPLD